MDPISQQLMMGAAGSGGPKLYVEDVFSTYLYTGNGSTQTITNGIDLSGKGGLVWLKDRTRANNNLLFDTERGTLKVLHTHVTGGQYTYANSLLSFNANGFEVGSNAEANENGFTYASWTFRKAAKFFDVVTYVGDGVAGRTVAHNLGSVPGCIIVKRTDSSASWAVFHTSLGASKWLHLNTTESALTNTAFWNNTAPTSSVFTVGFDTRNNASGATYVAYLFAHDAGGFGDSGNDSVVKCGSFTQASGGTTIDLGWEPQWVLIKTSSTAGNWFVFDNMRGNTVTLFPNLSNAETDQGADAFKYNANGFTLADFVTGSVGSTIIYIAIRRGPMKTPTDATKVFESVARTSAGPNLFSTALAVVDMAWNRERTFGASGIASTRLTGSRYLVPNSTAAEVAVTSGDLAYDYNYQINPYVWSPGNAEVNWLFRRAPGFFDVVAWTGTGAPQAYNHSLGVVPELMIQKRRDFSGSPWIIYSSTLGNTKRLYFDTAAAVTDTGIWDSTTPSSTTFTTLSGSGGTNISYLFASCPGVSKVGSYTGTGTTHQIDCGFTSGARFVLIKRTNTEGNWFVWDAARGIVAGNDPYLLLNSTSSESTFYDYIDPYPAGFELTDGFGGTNASGDSYIYLAIA